MAAKTLSLASLIVGSVLAHAGSASANGAILVVGRTSPHQHELIIDSVQRVAKEEGWWFGAPAFSGAESEAIVDCLAKERPWSCFAPKMRGKGDQLVVIQIELDQTDTVVTVHVVSAITNADATDRHFCEACNDETLTRAITEVTKELLHDTAARTGTTAIAIRSIPDEAWITLDGKPGGATNTVKATYPGEHVVVLRHAGYEPATRTVTATDGKTATIAIVLEPSKVARGGRTQPPEPPPPAWLDPRVVIGVGGLALLAGGLMVALDQDPDPMGQQRARLYNTAPAGAVIGIGGALLVGTGVYLWKRSTNPTPSPMVVLLPGGGAAVGWSIQF